MGLPFQAQIHQLNLAASNYSTCKPHLHKQAIPLSISSWGPYGRCDLSIHPTQQPQVILLLHYTCIGPLIRALIYGLIDPEWWLFLCCKVLSLNFHFPSGQLGFCRALSPSWWRSSPLHMFYSLGQRGTITTASKLGSPTGSVPVALPRMSLVMLLLNLSSYWSGNGKGLKVKVDVICRASEAESVGD